MLKIGDEVLISDITARGSSRITARIIDIIFEIIIITPICIWFFKNEELSGLLNVVCLGVIIFLEFIIPILTKGRTVGKLVCKLRIISICGSKANIIQLLLRSSIYILEIFVSNFIFGGLRVTVSLILIIVYIISLFSIFSDTYNRAIWDKLADVCVVRDDDYNDISQEQFPRRV